MEDLFLRQKENEILDFATTKRSEWEENHQLYSAMIEITPRCNFDCVHCYMSDQHEHEPLSTARLKEIIDILFEKEVLFLTFSGGEVFTRTDFAEIYMHAKKKGFIVELYSNGSMISDELIDLFIKYPPLLVDISLYGSNEETYQKVTRRSGMFERVVNNIRSLVEAGIRVSLKAPVLSCYYDQIPEMMKIATKFNLPFRTGFEIFPTVGNDASVQDFSVSAYEMLRYEFDKYARGRTERGEKEGYEYVDLPRERPLFRCKLGRASCSIDYKGNLCPCNSFRHAGQQLTRDSFDSIWQSFGEYPKMKASEDYPCLHCDAYNYCDICPAMMEFVYGDMEHIDAHFCKTAKARHRHYDLGESAEIVLASLGE